MSFLSMTGKLTEVKAGYLTLTPYQSGILIQQCLRASSILPQHSFLKTVLLIMNFSQMSILRE